MPLREVHLCLFLGISYCIAWRHLGGGPLIFFLSLSYFYSKLPITSNNPTCFHVFICAPKGLENNKPQSPSVILSHPFTEGCGIVRVEHNSCWKAWQEVVKRQTAKEENSILNLQNLPRPHWNTSLTLRWGSSEAEDGCQPRAVVQLFTYSLRL